MQFFERVCVSVYRKVRSRACYRALTVGQFKRMFRDLAEYVADNRSKQDRRIDHFSVCYPELATGGHYVYPHETFLDQFVGDDDSLLCEDPTWLAILDRYTDQALTGLTARPSQVFATIFSRALPKAA